MYEKRLMTMEVYIETLTGTAFKLGVSPFETVQDVKARIQKREGIPVSQQHLVWQSLELEDDYCLSDYSIYDGATLKLVLALRGGPINTRRIPMDEPTLREVAEYFSESTRDEMLEKSSPGNRPVTVIVYHNGDQVNFFRVVEREAASPLSESISGASMYNLYGEEEEDDGEEEEEDEEEEYEEEEEGEAGQGAEAEPTPSSVEKTEDNDKTREKMKLLRSKLESLTISKKQQQAPKKKLVPRPPSAGRPGSHSKLRRLPSYAGKHTATVAASGSGTLNKNLCLPPLGQTHPPAGGRGAVARGTAVPPRGVPAALSQQWTDVTPSARVAHHHAATSSETPREISRSSNVGNAQRGDEVGAGRATAVLTGGARPLALKRLESVESGLSQRKPKLDSVKEDPAGSKEAEAPRVPPLGGPPGPTPSATGGVVVTDRKTASAPSETLTQLLKKSRGGSSSPHRWDVQEVGVREAGGIVPHPPSTPQRPNKDSTASYKGSANNRPRHLGSRRLERLLSEGSACEMSGNLGHAAPLSQAPPHRSLSTAALAGASHNDPLPVALEALRESLQGRPGTSSRHAAAGGATGTGTGNGTSGDRKPAVVLETMHPSEVSGMLSDLVRSASKSRTAYKLTAGGAVARMHTPDRLMRLSAGRDGRVMTPSHRLPPVKKKKPSRRCSLCAKKTGIATSYPCRCGLNFCATHRYAETHECTFDYKTEGRKLLEQSNPVVSAPKLPKI